MAEASSTHGSITWLVHYVIYVWHIFLQSMAETSFPQTTSRSKVFGKGGRFCTVEIYRHSHAASSRRWSVTLCPCECLKASHWLNVKKGNVAYYNCLYFSFSTVAILPEKMLLLQLQQVYSSESKPWGHDGMSAERDTNVTATQSSLPVSVTEWISTLIKGELIITEIIYF